jgi:hypothetical protein
LRRRRPIAVSRQKQPPNRPDAPFVARLVAARSGGWNMDA